MDRILCMQSFARVAEAGSFSAVARQLNTTQSTVSKRIAALEDYLGVKLIHRSTRSRVLTEIGQAFYRDCVEILDRIEACEANLRGASTPTGLLRVSVPTALGELEIFPRLKGFLDRFPKLNMDAFVTDRIVDLIEEGVDVAIRVGHLQDSALIARRVGTARQVCVASPEYLTEHGTPTTPGELKDHQCISNFKSWRFKGPKGETRIPVTGRLQCNSPKCIRQAVLAGAGISCAPIWLYGRDIDSGQLEILLKEYEPLPMPIHALYPSRFHVPPKVPAFINYLEADFAVSSWVSDNGSNAS